MANASGYNESRAKTRVDEDGVAQLITYYGLTYYPPVLLLICLAGNILNYIVIARVCTDSSVSVYFRWLAVADTLAAYTYLARVWVHHAFGVLFTAASDEVCKLTTYVNYTSGDVAIWLMMAITADRLVAIVRPFLAKSFCTSRGAVIASLGMLLVAALKNFTIFFSYRVVNTRRETRCTYDSTHPLAYYDKVVRPLFVLTISGLVPAIIVLFLNSIVILHLIRHKRHMSLFNDCDNTYTPPGGRKNVGSALRALRASIPVAARRNVEQSSRKNAEAAAIVIVLANSLMFCVMVLPQFVLNVFKQFHYSDEIRAAQVFTTFLMYCNHSGNFYISFLASEAYRKKLRVTLECNKGAKAQQPARSSAAFSGSQQCIARSSEVS